VGPTLKPKSYQSLIKELHMLTIFDVVSYPLGLTRNQHNPPLALIYARNPLFAPFCFKASAA